MGKLVVLKLGDGSFQQGFSVTLQLGNDGDRPFTEVIGYLPPAPEISQNYSTWQSAYRGLGLRPRIKALPTVTNVSITQDCDIAAEVLRDRLNSWLHCKSFRPIREKLLEQLMPTDEVRVIIQTEDIWLRRLPWHLWDLCDRYPKAEIALSAPAYEGTKQPSATKTEIKILAILGDSTGINIEVDKALLEHLPNAKSKFLVEPRLQEIHDHLWQESWDVLFFAGHSLSEDDGKSGRIYINQTDSLTVIELRYALKRAVERGLKLAIFNSCDGLGLARDLAELHIPQVIVMREPVPDRVAQEFFRHFLHAFSEGQPLYSAVREAREGLQGLEREFPCATWLPVICQNPAEIPLAWPKQSPKSLSFSRRFLQRLLLTSVAVTTVVMGIRYVGALQPLELQAYDQLLKLRPDEGQDSRILVVTIDEADIEYQDRMKMERKGSLSDLALAQLVNKLQPYQPRAIGLDIIHDFPVDPKQKSLATQLRIGDNFFAICKYSDPQNNQVGTLPPPEIPLQRQGFNDVVIDADGSLRRYLIAQQPISNSPCTTPYAFSAQLAFHYLEEKGISVKYTKDTKDLQLGKVVFKRLRSHMGGYQLIDDWGYQVLLNYRSYRTAQEIVEKVSLTDLLTGKFKSDAVKDQIVLIGVTAPSVNDYFVNPYSADRGPYEKMPGVFIHAQMISQILNAALDGRSPLWVWPQWGEFLWVWSWSLAGGILAWRFCSIQILGIASFTTLAVLWGLCFGFIIQSIWLPIVPSALAFIITGGTIAASSKQRYQP